MTEKEFLARVSSRLGRKDLSEVGQVNWAPSQPLPLVGPTDTEKLVELFVQELTKMSGQHYRVASAGEVAPLIAQILKESELEGTVVRWDDPLLAEFGIDEALKTAGYEVVPFKGENGRALVETAERSCAGITACDAAIAETGTLVLGSSHPGDAKAPGRGRVVSLLPKTHIVVLRKEQIVFHSAAVFRMLAKGAMPSQVIFETGPSRSADIENDLSIGVHGPGYLHVIIL